jgi:subfamily B ATP-binding cassette protein MsbA
MFSLMNGLSVYLSIPLLDTLFQESSGTARLVEQSPLKHSPQVMGFLEQIKYSISEFFTSYIFTGDKITSLLRICLIVLSAFFLKNIFGYLEAYFLAFVEQGTARDIRNAAYRHLHRLPITYFKNEKTGHLISRIMNDVNVILASISGTFINLTREPLSIIVFLGMAISISWKLTTFSFVVLPFSMIIISWMGLKLRKQVTYIQEKLADITNVLQETITGVKIVKAFGMEEYENRKFMRETTGYFKLMLRIVRIRNLASPLTEFLSVIVGVVIIYFGGQLVLVEKSLKASEFLGFLFAIFQLMPPIKVLSGVNNQIQEATAAGSRVFEIIDEPPTITNREHPIAVKNLKKEIVFDNVTFQYADADEPVLSSLSFTVQRGEIIALVGPSGGGKSTLVDLLPRFYDVTGGSILLDGIDIRDYDLADLRGLMGIVTQETILFNENIRNNIAYGLEQYPIEEIIEAAKMANAHQFISEIPEGYDTVIGERGVKLSGGQRQRLSIARALLKNPEIMIFDEATSALDNESEQLVQEAIERLMINRTSFVIAHRLSTIRNASRIIVIEKGRIVQTGTHADLIADERGLYKKLYEMQFRDPA